MLHVKRRLNSTDVVDTLTDLFILCGPPENTRSDNGAEFITKKVRAWIGAVEGWEATNWPSSREEHPSRACKQALTGDARTNGYCESFSSQFREELRNTEAFNTLREAQILIERWRRHYSRQAA
jgi:transposase InsO family protein